MGAGIGRLPIVPKVRKVRIFIVKVAYSLSVASTPPGQDLACGVVNPAVLFQ
ncbi:MAG: hypothetical protein ACI9G1_005794 [Pirellulaceae bacterium]|jgi:hypothetical protein